MYSVTTRRTFALAPYRYRRVAGSGGRTSTMPRRTAGSRTHTGIRVAGLEGRTCTMPWSSCMPNARMVTSDGRHANSDRNQGCRIWRAHLHHARLQLHADRAHTHTGSGFRAWRAHLHHALVQLHAEGAHGLVRRQARELVQALLDEARALVRRLRRRLDHLRRLRSPQSHLEPAKYVIELHECWSGGCAAVLIISAVCAVRTHSQSPNAMDLYWRGSANASRNITVVCQHEVKCMRLLGGSVAV